MAYRRKTQNEVLLEILSYLTQNTNGKITDYNVGSVLHSFANSVAAQIAADDDNSLFTQLDKVYASAHIDTATEDDLEQIAILFGLTRQTGDESTGTVTFIRNNPATVDFTINAGTRVATTPQIDENQRIFEVDADTTFYSSITAETQLYTNGIYNYPLEQRFVSSISQIETTISSVLQVLGATNYKISNYDDYILLSNTNLKLIDDMESNSGWENTERTISDACDAVTGWTAGTDGAITLNNTSGEYIEGTGSLQLDKSGATTDTVLYSKTLGTGINLTTDEHKVSIVVDDLTVLAGAGTVVKVICGTDNSNYYYKEFEQSDFDEGIWKEIKISSTNNDGDTGTPTATNCPYIAIEITYAAAGTTASNKIRMDYWNYYTMPVENTATFKQGLGSLELFKTNAATNNITFYKEFTPAVNVYGYDGFIWFYIDDEATLNKLDYINILAGSNSTNYFNNIFYREDLIVGWNPLYCINSTLTGNPSSSQIVYEGVEIYTNNDTDIIASGKILIDWFAFGDIISYKGNVLEFIGSTYPDDGEDFFVNYIPLSTEVDCTAIDIGLDYNVSSNKITYLITPNSNITSINNYSAFTGGTDIESDEDLRQRIKTNAIGLGLGTESAIKAAIENVEGVASANVIGTPLTDAYGPSGSMRTKEAHIMNVASGENVLDYEMVYLDDNVAPTNVIIADSFDDNVADWIYGTHYTINPATNKIIWDTTNPGTTCPADTATFYIGYQYNWIGHIQIYVAGNEIPISASLTTEIDNIIDETKSAGDIASWSEPNITSINIEATITIDSGYSTSTVVNNVEEAINSYINTLLIGEDVYKNNIVQTILNVDGVNTVSLTAPLSDTTIADNEIARVGSINIIV